MNSKSRYRPCSPAMLLVGIIAMGSISAGLAGCIENTSMTPSKDITPSGMPVQLRHCSVHKFYDSEGYLLRVVYCPNAGVTTQTGKQPPITVVPQR